MLGVLFKPAVHRCSAIADLYERQICIGVTAVKHACYQLFLQSVTEPESMLGVLFKPAVHRCSAIADLYERQTCKGVTAVTHACYQLFLQSVTESESMLGVCSNLLCISVQQLQTCMKGKLV